MAFQLHSLWSSFTTDCEVTLFSHTALLHQQSTLSAPTTKGCEEPATSNTSSTMSRKAVFYNVVTRGIPILHNHDITILYQIKMANCHHSYQEEEFLSCRIEKPLPRMIAKCTEQSVKKQVLMMLLLIFDDDTDKYCDS